MDAGLLLHVHTLVWPARPLSPLQIILSIMNRRGGVGLAGQTNVYYGIY